MILAGNKSPWSVVLLGVSVFLLFSSSGCKPDLAVEISGPLTVNAGHALDTVTVQVENVGKATALGMITTGGQEDSGGYMDDIVLSSDDDLPVQWVTCLTLLSKTGC